MTAYLMHAAVSGTIMSSIAYGKPADFDKLIDATKELLYRVLAPTRAKNQ
jgi:hypothetical protein